MAAPLIGKSFKGAARGAGGAQKIAAPFMRAVGKGGKGGGGEGKRRPPPPKPPVMRR